MANRKERRAGDYLSRKENMNKDNNWLVKLAVGRYLNAMIFL